VSVHAIIGKAGAFSVSARWTVLLAAGLALASALLGPAAAQVIQANPENYNQLVSRLGPGDTLKLSAGVYVNGLTLKDMAGVPGMPIRITGPTRGDPALFVAQDGRNTISLRNVAYVVIEHLTLDGNGIPVDAVKAEGDAKFAHHITVRGLRIVNHGANQQIVGISSKCPAWDWLIQDNVIVGAGTGIYLGNPDGSAPFVRGIIEGNVIRDTIGYNLQIKQQNALPSGLGIPKDPTVTVIRFNTFSKSHGGSTGGSARPNVLVGHFPPSGPGEFDRYLIYGNFFYENPTEALLQGEGRLAIYDNLFVNPAPGAMAVRLTAQKGELRYAEFFHNTVLAGDRGVGVWNPTPGGRFWVGANAIFAARPIGGDVTRGWNRIGDLNEARDYLTAPFAPLGKMDLHPLPGALDNKHIPAGSLVSYPGAGHDFDGRIRNQGVAGAYAGPGKQGDWVLDLGSAPPNYGGQQARR